MIPNHGSGSNEDATPIKLVVPAKEARESPPLEEKRLLRIVPDWHHYEADLVITSHISSGKFLNSKLSEPALTI